METATPKTNTPPKDPAEAAPTRAMPPGREQIFRDRAYPLWAKTLSSIFATACGISWLSVSILALFIVDLALVNNDLTLLYVLTLAGAMALAAGFALEMSHVNALSGFYRQRQRFTAKTQAAMAVFLGFFLAAIHPVLPLGLLLAAGLHFLAPLILRLFPSLNQRPPPEYAKAVAMLAGRDPQGVAYARQNANDPPEAVDSLARFCRGLAVLLTLSIGAFLSINGVLTLGGVFATTLMGYWAINALTRWSQHLIAEPPAIRITPLALPPPPEPAPIDPFEDPPEEEEGVKKGLSVVDLTLKSALSRDILLSKSSFEVPPGHCLGLTGDAGGGKTLLLQAVIGQTNSASLMLRGAVSYDGKPLWQRQFRNISLPAYYLPSQPMLLPGSPLDNITCFNPEADLAEARNALQRLDVFGLQSARILARDDALTLSATEAQLLSLARGFLLNPGLYLLDMPENNLTNPLINALAHQIKVEKNAGRSFIIASRNRTLLDLCDSLLVLQDGYIADRGESDVVTARLASGWSRLVLDRNSASEDRLHNWTRAQFNRRGDEENRRNGCLLASEMLALSCEGNTADTTQVIFEFHHFKTACEFTLQDADPALSTARLQAAQRLVKSQPSLSPRHPLANILKLSEDFTQEIKGLDKGLSRKLRVRMATFDPRLTPSHQASESRG